MAREPAYRVPRRFITHPEEPPPYGLVALSFTGHLVVFFGAMVLSMFLSTRLDQSKIYIVNLVPAAPPVGSPAPRPVGPPGAARPVREPVPSKPAAPPVPPTPRVEERTPPKPPKAEAPPAPLARVETPAPLARPEKPPDPIAPPRVAELAPRAAVRPPELALPRRVEKETPTLDNPAARQRLVDRPLLPPAPPATPAPARGPEPPRVASPQAPPAPPIVASVRSGVDPARPGRPDSVSSAAPNISLDVNDFPFTYYLRQLKAKVEERFTPPRPVPAGGARAIILFEIGRDGQVIKDPVVERSSGSALYDQAALRAVTEARPFPPLPPEFKAPSLRVHFGFDDVPEQG